MARSATSSLKGTIIRRCSSFALAALLLALAQATVPGLAQAGPGLPSGSGGWSWQVPLPTGDDLTDLACLSDGSTVICTAGQMMLRTMDGSAWDCSRVNGVDRSTTFAALSFPGGGMNGWVAGRSSPYLPSAQPSFGDPPVTGVIARTTDGGRSWTCVATLADASISDLCFVDATHGWAVGTDMSDDYEQSPLVLVTSDGGATWARQRPPGSFSSVVSACFTDEHHGCIATWPQAQADDPDHALGGSIMITGDGGASWRTAFTSAEDSINGIAFADGLHGWAVGAGGLIVHTGDGGESWQLQEQYDDFNLLSICAVDGAHAVATREYSGVVVTRDGGQTWRTVSLPDAGQLRAAAFHDWMRGWMIGSWSTIVRTADGATWSRVSSQTLPPLVDVRFADRLQGFVLTEYGGVLSSLDGGQTWIERRPTRWKLRSVSYSALALKESRAWAVGDAGWFLHSEDGGATWQSRRIARSDLYDVVIADSRVGWAVGAGVVLRTGDGGMTWRNRAPRKVIALEVAAWGARRACVLAADRIVTTADAGRTWHARKLPPATVVVAGRKRRMLTIPVAMSFTDMHHGWLVACPGLIAGDIRSSESRLDILRRHSAVIRQAGARTLYLLGGVRLYQTSDGGRRWKAAGQIRGLLPWSVDATADGTLWAVGQLATVAADTRGSRVSVFCSSDRGRTWEQREPPVVTSDFEDAGYYSFDFVDGSAGWAVSKDGRIAATITGGRVQ